MYELCIKAIDGVATIVHSLLATAHKIMDRIEYLDVARPIALLRIDDRSQAV